MRSNDRKIERLSFDRVPAVPKIFPVPPATPSVLVTATSSTAGAAILLLSHWQRILSKTTSPNCIYLSTNNQQIISYNQWDFFLVHHTSMWRWWIVSVQHDNRLATGDDLHKRIWNKTALSSNTSIPNKWCEMMSIGNDGNGMLRKPIAEPSVQLSPSVSVIPFIFLFRRTVLDDLLVFHPAVSSAENTGDISIDKLRLCSCSDIVMSTDLSFKDCLTLWGFFIQGTAFRAALRSPCECHFPDGCLACTFLLLSRGRWCPQTGACISSRKHRKACPVSGVSEE